MCLKSLNFFFFFKKNNNNTKIGVALAILLCFILTTYYGVKAVVILRATTFGTSDFASYLKKIIVGMLFTDVFLLILVVLVGAIGATFSPQPHLVLLVIIGFCEGFSVGGLCFVVGVKLGSTSKVVRSEKQQMTADHVESSTTTIVS
jgi:hypothetical protein